MLVGVISDTHGLFRPQVQAHFQGVDRIIHAGDVGSGDILDRLEELAPVWAVQGNTDHHPSLLHLPSKLRLCWEGVRILVVHILEDPAALRSTPRMAEQDLIIFGHTHRPHLRRLGKTLYFNPGSAGPRRFSLPLSIGLLRLQEGMVEARLIPLED